MRKELCNKFKTARAKYKQNILNKKRNSFKNYITNITMSGTFGSAYKIIKAKTKINNIDNRIKKIMVLSQKLLRKGER